VVYGYGDFEISGFVGQKKPPEDVLGLGVRDSLGVACFKRFCGVSVDLAWCGGEGQWLSDFTNGLAVCGSAVFINELGGGGALGGGPPLPP